MLINLLRHAKSAICVISVIIDNNIDMPAIVYTLLSCLCCTPQICQCCTSKQIDLTSVFVTIQRDSVKGGIQNNGIREFQLSAFFIQNPFYPCVTAGKCYTRALKCWKPDYL